MARKGWVKLFHRLADNQMWLESRFTPGQAWVDLLLIASTMETDEPGKVYCSILWLAERWKWSRDKVRLYLKRLEKDGMIVLQQNGHEIRQRNRQSNRHLLTIVKYRRYQIDRQQNRQQNQQQNQQQNRHIEEDKEKPVRHAEAGGTEVRKIPEAFRGMFESVEEYEEWRRINS